MTLPPIKRPRSLAEVASETETYRDFGMNLKDFMHEFVLAKQQADDLAIMLSSEPQRLARRFPEGIICDAFLGGTADYLSRINRLNTPLWALNENLMLESPWFAEPWIEVRALLLRDTPSAFKDKNIFIFASAFNVA